MPEEKDRSCDDGWLLAHGLVQIGGLPSDAAAAHWLTIGLSGPEISKGKPVWAVGATHAWGWAGQALFRGRFDDQGTGLILAELRWIDPGDSTGASVEKVPLVKDTVTLWEIDEGRLSKEGRSSMRAISAALGGSCEAYTTLNAAPIVFVGPPSSNG